MRFTKILCPIDFSTGSRQAMRTAIRIANEHGAELVLFHAWHVSLPMEDGMYILPGNVITAMADDAQRGVEAAVRDAKEYGAKQVSGKCVTGVPWAEITRMLEKQAFDLCVMGTHGRTGLSRVFLGSVAEKIVRHAPCSVLVVRPDGEPRPYTHVVCPTDFSKSAAAAVDLATQLVAPEGALVLLHVIEVPFAVSDEPTLTQIAKDLDRKSIESLAQEGARLQSRTRATIKTQSRVGSAGAEILAALEAERTADLVVMGSHGRTGIARVLLGSVAEKVLRHAKCAVLVGRDRA
jgi:nucleotide-binding universal stress UspA family protein